MKLIALLIVELVSVAYALQPTQQAGSIEEPPEGFYFDPNLFFEMYQDNRDPRMIIDISQYWNTKTQLQHFEWLENRIKDEKLDEKKKAYARSIKDEASKRMKEAFQELGFVIDYDLLDVIREIKNLDESPIPLIPELKNLLIAADEKAEEMRKKEKERLAKEAEQAKNGAKN